MDTHDERVKGQMGLPSGFLDLNTREQQDEVRKELRTILAGSCFEHTKRYAAVLTYIVNQAIEGKGDQLKERTIGIEVFHRAPDYDTASDHVVRSAFAEIRKRLAKHYELDAKSRLRIEVLPGSYLPQFRWIEEPPLLAPTPSGIGPTEAADTEEPSAGVGHAKAETRWRLERRTIYAVLILALVVFSAAGVRLAYIQSHDVTRGFWKPILASHAPVLLCIGDMEGGLRLPDSHANLSSALTLSDFQNSPFETASVYDAMTMAKFAGFLQANGRSFRPKWESDATFTDLQNGPTILVGLLNNNWTERLVPNLRFTVENISGKFIIRDRNNASRQDWSVDYQTPYLDVTRDYALVLRMLDPKTEQMVVVAAGITVFGTSAAGNFLTSKTEIRKLAAVAPPGWEKMNMELVLSTDVIRGGSGPATIVAAQFW